MFIVCERSGSQIHDRFFQNLLHVRRNENYTCFKGTLTIFYTVESYMIGLNEMNIFLIANNVFLYSIWTNLYYFAFYFIYLIRYWFQTVAELYIFFVVSMIDVKKVRLDKIMFKILELLYHFCMIYHLWIEVTTTFILIVYYQFILIGIPSQSDSLIGFLHKFNKLIVAQQK